MKKFIISLLLIPILFSCTKKEDFTYSIKVQLITDSNGIEDRSFNESTWMGILNYYGDNWSSKRGLGTAYDVVTCKDETEYISKLTQAALSDSDLIIATGFSFAMAMQNVALKFPEKRFLIIDVGNLTGIPNLMQAVFAEHEGSYLVGKAIALKAVEEGYSGSPTFGFIGGVKDPTITKFEVGYIQGVLSVIKQAKFNIWYADGWDKSGEAKEKAKEWYNSGTYAIYHAAGGCGIGMIAEAVEQRRAGKNVWAIGVDIDQHELGKYSDRDPSAVFTSMIKKCDTSAFYALTAVENRAFKGEVITFDLANDGVGYSIANKELSQESIAILEQTKKLIINGDIIVGASSEEAREVSFYPIIFGE